MSPLVLSPCFGTECVPSQVLSHVAQIIFGEVQPNQFRWINPPAPASAPASASAGLQGGHAAAGGA
jgi:hypothetical protein